MSLPEWAEESVMNTGTHVALKEALTIAWEALEKIRTSAPCIKDHESFNTPGQLCDQRMAEDAMRRIEEMG